MNTIPKLLPGLVVDQIRNFISEKINNYNERPLKEDVFNVLRDYAVLVFYPLPEGEENDAFLLSNMPWDNEKKRFVFINSSKTKEKQIFAAAHELGHILMDSSKMDEFEEDEELIVNRMAAELLMPDNLFRIQVKEQVKTEGSIAEEEFIDLVIHLMAYFSCPYESIILRFYELRMITKDRTEYFIHRKSPYLQEDYIHRRIIEKNYEDLMIITRQKSIDGLDEVIQKLEENGQLSNKAKKLKEKYVALTEQEIADVTRNSIKLKL